MQIEAKCLEEFTKRINERLGKYYASPNRNAWNKLNSIIQEVMKLPINLNAFKWLFEVYKLIPDELLTIDPIIRLRVVRLRLSGEWDTYKRIYELEREFTSEEIEKIQDVLFAWYIYDKWVTGKTDLCEIK